MININYLAALAITTLVGVVIGALMIRREARRMERSFRALREEMERRANTHPPITAFESSSPDAPAE